jgi:hypothetical protein
MTLTPELLAGHAVDQEPYGRIEGHQKAGEGAEDDRPGVDVIQICFVLSVTQLQRKSVPGKLFRLV